MNIQRKIKISGFTMAEVAARMKNQRGGTGISQGSLSTAINGNPSIDKLREVADIIGMSLSELVADGDNSDFIAMIRRDGKYYHALSEDDLRALLDQWNAESERRQHRRLK